MRLTAIVLLALLSAPVVLAQDFSNKGRDFWLGYGYHVRYVTPGQGCSGNCQEMVLYFATENIPGRFTDITISIPGTGYTETISNVAPGTIVTSSPIPKFGAQDARLTNEGLFNTGIHVTATRPVVAYTHIYNGNVSGATLLFPTNTLGKEYYSLNYNQVSNEDFSNGFFFVVAADTGTTTVEITPSAPTQNNAANVPFTVTLQQGQIYNVMGQLTGGVPGNFTGVDLTGSRIRSISTAGGVCKRIAVFSGTGKMKISCNNANSADNFIAQAFPKTAWGKRYLTVPTQNMPNNYFRVAVSDPSTVVRVNGAVITGLINNFYYDLPLTDQPQLIEASEPIMVAQFITTANTCGNNLLGGVGDPEMIYLSPIEQTIDEVIVNSTPNASINQHWINVVIKTAAVPSFTITGAASGFGFTPHPQDPTYSYAQISVNSGTHILTADSGFNAIAYGYGGAESYGYNAGTNIKDLYNFIKPLNPLNITGANTACACTPFFLSVTYPFQPTSLFWDFKGFQTPNVSISNPVADSTYLINGKQVWRYRLPSSYTYCPAGNYPISITAGTVGTEGCGNTQTKDDTIFVKNTPTPDFSAVFNGCVTDSVRFAETTVYEQDVYSYIWNWDFGDGTTSTLPNPAHRYATPGNYTVKLTVVTNVGCISSTAQKTISVAQEPIAKFGISNLLCASSPVLFTDSSTTLPPATLGSWVWNLGNGTVINATTNASQTATYLLPGEYTASLQVATPSGCTSRLFTQSFTVNPRPVASFVMPAAVCLPYQQAQFTDASTISDGTAGSFAWLWTFGEPESGTRDTAIIKNPQHLYGGTGPFSVRLRVTSNNGCVDDTVQVLRNVFAKAISNFTANPENCLNVATTFTSTADGQGSAIANWFWNVGDGSAVRNGQTTSYTYPIADTFVIRHWITTDKGCNSDTAASPVIIHPLPVANFNFSTPLCRNNAITFTPLATVATGTVTTYRWNFDQFRPDSLVSNGNAFIRVFDSVRAYNVRLSVSSDKGCVNAAPITRALAINPLPRPGFISPEVCLSDASAVFTDTSSIAAGSISSWSWNFGDPLSPPGSATSTLRNPTHRYSAIGNYSALLVTTSNAGCVDSVRQSFTVNGDRPVAGFRVQNLPGYCASDSVVIKDSSTVNFGNITKVEIIWDNGTAPTVVETDDLPTPGKIYKHKYPAFQTPLTKVVSIRYVAYSGSSCIDDEIRTVTLHAVPKTQFVTIPPVCLDATSFTITQASEIGGVPGLGVYSGFGVSAAGIFTPAQTGAGVFPIKYVYSSAFGCRDSVSSNLTVLAPAVPKFGVSTVRCETAAISFTDSSTIPAASGTVTQWRWSFGDGSAAIVNNNNAAVTHTYSSAGTYQSSLTLTSSNGCITTVQVPVQVSPMPVPAFTFPARVCMPEGLVQFTDASAIADGTSNAFTYNWNFGDPGSTSNTSIAKNPAHQYTTVRSYDVSLEVTSGARCKKSVTIPVNILHPQPVAAFTSDSVSVCQNQAVQFIDNSTGADGVVTNWDWSFGNGSSSTQQVPPTQRFANAGNYNVTLRIQNSFGCKDTAQKTFIVYAFPIVDAGPDRVLLQGGEITLQPTVSGSGLQYSWLPNRYMNNNRIAQPVVSGLVEDEIVYTLAVTATGGCRTTDEVKVTLLKAPVIPNTFSPNGDGINENWTILYLESYPNCRLQVFDRAGQRVYEKTGYTAPGWDGTFKGKPLPFGTYYYVIEPGSGRQPITGYVTLLK